MDSPLPVDQKPASTGFTYARNAVRLAGQRIEFWRTRFPSPQPTRHSGPEIALAVLIQTDHSLPKTAVLSVALDAAIPNGAEPASRNHHPRDPYRAFPIQKELQK